MQRISKISELRAAMSVWREAGDSVALVPTMGNLHRGHMSLVDLAAAHAEHVVVSVFVNPTQFGPDEDYADYPRTLDLDARRLARAGVEIMFAPAVSDMYPHGMEHATRVSVPKLSDQLCGAARPGHFEGVTSVVCRLLNICEPGIAVFGQKDYQQFIILQRMVEDLHIPARLLAGPTRRDKNGLARSSRNGFLSKQDKGRAAVIYAALTAAADELSNGNLNFSVLEQTALDEIAAAGLEPEYVSIRAAGDLGAPDTDTARLVVLAAARLGKVRLIDNVLVKAGID